MSETNDNLGRERRGTAAQGRNQIAFDINCIDCYNYFRAWERQFFSNWNRMKRLLRSKEHLNWHLAADSVEQEIDQDESGSAPTTYQLELPYLTQR